MKNTIVLAFAFGLIGTTFADFTCSVKVAEGKVGVSRTATATYAGGGTDSPLVRVEAGADAYVRFSEADGWSKSVEFLAMDGDGTQDFFCLVNNKDARLALSYTLGSTNKIPWSTMKLWKTARPTYVESDAWIYAEYELEKRMGTTWRDYHSRLKANAEYLEGLGLKTRRTDRLMALEINRALGVNAAVPTLASATDISRSARGLPLAFSRSFSSATYAHFKCGTLGYGWTDNYSIYVERVDEETLAIRHPSGGSYSYSKVRGAWQSEDVRDVTKLTESSDAYTLTYENGLAQTFAKSNMRLSTMVDSVGNVLTFAWLGATNLLSVMHTDGQCLRFAYNDDGLLSSVTDDLGNRVSYVYNSNKMLTAVTGTDGLVTKYSYNDSSFALKSRYARTLSCVTCPDLTTRTFNYNASTARLYSIADGTGAMVKFSYPDPDIATIRITASDGGVTTVDMGPSGEVLKATDALGNVVTRTYDGDGLIQSILMPSGKSGQYAYDARGRVTMQTSAAGNKTTFDYTELFGNLKTLKDAKNQSVTYGYDDKGRATSVTFPDGAKMLVEYSEKGDVAKTTNCRGQSEAYGYDAEGRVTSRTWANGRAFTYAYDAKGRLVTATDSESGKVTMAYDDGDRLAKITYPNSRGFTFSYDTAGRLTKRAALDGTAECYTYDAAGRVSEVTDGNGQRYVLNAYDVTTGRLAGQLYGNGTSTSYLYDLCGRITSIVHKDASGKITESLQYCYDEDGRCIRAASLLGEERYAYDDDGQLTGVNYPVGENESFAYDAVGNRTSANSATYTVNNLNQYTAVDAVGSAPRADRFTYDADGNLTSKTDSNGTTTYTYDQQNRLIAVSNPTTKLDWSCTYDVLGNRVSVTTNGVTTMRVTLPGALPSVAAEYQNGKLVKRHIVVGATQIADIDAAGNSNYYHGDLIGSTRLITDQTGATVNRLSYKAFGEVRSSMTRRDSAAGYVGTLGVETDPTGLLFMRNRYYDPQLGRFLQRDPLDIEGDDVNFYRYSRNDPISYADPSGLWRLRTDVARNMDRCLKQSGKGNKYFNTYMTYVTDFAVFAARHARKNIWPHLKVGFEAGLHFFPSLFTTITGRGVLGSIITFGADWLLGEDLADDAASVSVNSSELMYNLMGSATPKNYSDASKILGAASVLVRGSDAYRMIADHISTSWESLDDSQTESYDVDSGDEDLDDDDPDGDDPGDDDSDDDDSDDDDSGGDDPGDTPIGGDETPVGTGVVTNWPSWNAIYAGGAGCGATFDLGADLVQLMIFGVPERGYVMQNFTGMLNGNGYNMTVVGNVPMFEQATGATFNDLGDLTIYQSDHCTFNNCTVYIYEDNGSTFNNCKVCFTEWHCWDYFDKKGIDYLTDSSVFARSTGSTVTGGMCEATVTHKSSFANVDVDIDSSIECSFASCSGSIGTDQNSAFENCPNLAVKNAKASSQTSPNDERTDATEGIRGTLSAALPSFATTASESSASHLDAYDSYVLIKSYAYSFQLASDAGAAVSVAGLPTGLVFADGCVTGKVESTGMNTVTISAGGKTKTVTFEVIDAPTGFAAQYKSAGGEVPEKEDPGDDPGQTCKVALTLATGWNWVSLSVVPSDAAIGAVFSGVSFADEDVVKSAEGFATYSGGKWYGELATIKPGVAYMVKKSTAGSQTLTVAGTAAETAVAVKTGWNWIGPTATAEVSLDALTHSGGFTDEDVIKSADAFATYAGGKWYGELKSLKPGVGYKAKFAKGGTLTFGK